MTDLPEGVTYELYGDVCPVQADGMVDGKPLYFRSRGSSWYVGIGGEPVGRPEWYCRVDYPGGKYEAGWIADDEAKAFIAQAVKEYREGKPSHGIPLFSQK